MRFNFAAIVGFAASAMGLTVTNPKQGDQVDLSKPLDIKWKNVQNDPKSLIIELVNMNGMPNVSKTLAENVSTADGHYKVDKVWGVPKAESYQINIVSHDEMNTGILGQSQQFNVTKVADPPKTSKRDSSINSTASKSTTCTYPSQTITPNPSSPPPSPSSTLSSKPCTTRTVKTTSRPCIKHQTSTPPSSTTPSDSTAPGTTTHATATDTAPAETSTTGAASSLAAPAAGSLMMSLFALML